MLVIEEDPFVRHSLLRLADETATLFVVETFAEALDLFDGGALFDDVLYPANSQHEAWLRRRLCRHAA